MTGPVFWPAFLFVVPAGVFILAYRYDVFPYPARDPEDERDRLLTGSPSDLREIDHYIYDGCRDWSKPFRVLIAGGGTGDGLVMLAQQLHDANTDHEIVYVDRSEKSAEVARQRLNIRGLKSVDFIVGDFLNLDDRSGFDYVDCCGVLHHLPDPQVGFAKIASLIRPDGGMGGMVYAPLGRTGVYPLQSAFGKLLGDLDPETRVASAKEIFNQLPQTNWILQNPFLNDHRIGDAGFFDLLLHVHDRPFWADEICAALASCCLTLASFIEPIRYDPSEYVPEEYRPQIDKLPPEQKYRLAEELSGSMKTHVFYARARPNPGTTEHCAYDLSLTPQPMGVDFESAFATKDDGRNFTVTLDGNQYSRHFSNASLACLQRIDGSKTLGEIAEEIDPALWKSTIEPDLDFLVRCGCVVMSSLRF